MEDLGFIPKRLWNERAHVFVQCGGFPDPRIMPGPNVAWVDFPNYGDAGERILQSNTLEKILNSVVSSWDPDWARISTNDLDSRVHPENPYIDQLVGWFTYISNRYGPVPTFPSDYNVRRFGPGGHLIRIDSIERPTAFNETHVLRLRQLAGILRQAGMLTPVPPT
jgi:hypothetical protein